jgi:dnd system-associated protein 4
VLRNVNRSEEHEDFVQSLAREGDGSIPSAFATIRELLTFAAVLAFQMEEFEPINKANGSQDIDINVFKNNDSDDYIYTLAVAHTKSADVLKASSDVDMVEIFEGYANAGLTILKSWVTQYRSQNGFQAIVQGLHDNGFIEEDTLTRENLIDAIKF